MRPSNVGGGHGREILGTGPLLTSHLRVRDLDRELNELRRRREMIQREQQMLSMECEIDRKRQYEQANCNMPNMYGKVWLPPPKRANVPQQMKPWRAPTQDYTMNMSKPMPSNYIPSLLDTTVEMPHRPFMSSSSIVKPIIHPILQDNIGGRIGKPALRARNNNGISSQSNKIMRKRPQDPPNKLNSYPVKERKDFIAKALDKPIAAVKTSSNVEKTDTLILRGNQVPSPRVTGRLELALGNLVKDIKLAYNDNAEFQQLLLKNHRIMKQAIRDRLRTVMLNQVVGSVSTIVSKYRQKYPKDTDKDIVDLVITFGRHKLDNALETVMRFTEHPEEYFKRNIENILDKKIREMSSNLLKLYTCRQPSKSAADTITELNGSIVKESATNSEEAMKIIRHITGKYVAAEELDVLNRFYTELIEKILEKKIPEYLPKCKEQFLKIFDLDKRMAHIRDVANRAAMANAEKKLNKTVDTMEDETLVKDEIAEGDSEVNDVEEKKEDEIAEGDSEVDGVEQKKVNENQEMVTEPIADNIESSKTNDTLKETDSTKIKETISAAENHVAMETDKIEEVSRVTIGSIKESPKATLESKPQLSPATNEPKTPVPNKTQVSPANIKPDTPMPKKTELSCTSPKTPVQPGTPNKELPYFIKLIGRPKLPTRPVICEFLNNYKPASIKKHKSINNLLVVGFNNEDDYNRILKANETAVGDITIIIKGSEKAMSSKENESFKESPKQNGKEINTDIQKVTQNSATNEVVVKVAQEKITESAKNTEESKDLIGQELDDQITDLLTTIRESDEDKPEENSKKELPETNDDKSQESIDSEKSSLATIKEDDAEVKNEDNNDSNKAKGAKASVKDAATPVRSSSRLANVTPSTIRTRRASRLMQE